MRETFGAKLLGNVTSLAREILFIITKLPYNAHSDWLKQRALSENSERVDDGKLSFKFLLRNFDKFGPNYTSSVTQTNMVHGDEQQC